MAADSIHYGCSVFTGNVLAYGARNVGIIAGSPGVNNALM